LLLHDKFLLSMNGVQVPDKICCILAAVKQALSNYQSYSIKTYNVDAEPWQNPSRPSSLFSVRVFHDFSSVCAVSVGYGCPSGHRRELGSCLASPGFLRGYLG